MLKEKLKLLWKKEQFRVWVYTSVASLAWMIWSWIAYKQIPGFFRNVSDYAFVVGLLHFVMGGTRYVHNVGLFKTFRWTAYRRRTQKAVAKDGVVLRPMSLAEFTEKYIYADEFQKDVRWPLITGLIWMAVSMVLALIA